MPDQPVLGNSRVRLLSLNGQSRERLFQIATDPRSAFKWRSVGPGFSRRNFDRVLDENVIIQLVIVDVASDSPVGLLQAINANFYHGTAHLTLLLDPSFRRLGWPLEAALIFMDYLFVSLPLRKLVLEVPEQNWKNLQRGLDRIFEYEGLLRAQEWHLGAYRDIRVYGITRESFRENVLIMKVISDAH